VADLRRSIEDLHGSEMLTSDRAHNDWTRQVAAIVGQVDEFNAGGMLTTSAVYDNLQGMAKELQATTKEFRENPKNSCGSNSSETLLKPGDKTRDTKPGDRRNVFQFVRKNRRTFRLSPGFPGFPSVMMGA